jgi:RimJ/RimL family protein N-acetyltransferase
VPHVRIEPWSPVDLELLQRLVGDAQMTEHIGGPEAPERIVARQRRYEQAQPGDRMFRVVDDKTGAAVGSVGYWPRRWNGGDVHEIGWSVLTAWQGRRVAGRATALAVEAARADGVALLHAFPSVGNVPSNAICRKLGFGLAGECRFEYPPGHWMRCNDWRLGLQVATGDA